MMEWLLGKRKGISLEKIRSAQVEARRLEEEIKKLYKIVNNEVLNFAINDRIDKLNKLKEEITI